MSKSVMSVIVVALVVAAGGVIFAVSGGGAQHRRIGTRPHRPVGIGEPPTL